MEKKNFWKTNAGALTIAFIATMIGFMMILFGINHNANGMSTIGFIAIVAAMLISPIKVFVIDRNRK